MSFFDSLSHASIEENDLMYGTPLKKLFFRRPT